MNKIITEIFKLFKNLFELNKEIINALNFTGLALTTYGIWLVTGEKNQVFLLAILLFFILAISQVILSTLKI